MELKPEQVERRERIALAVLENREGDTDDVLAEMRRIVEWIESRERVLMPENSVDDLEVGKPDAGFIIRAVPPRGDDGSGHTVSTVPEQAAWGTTYSALSPGSYVVAGGKLTAGTGRRPLRMELVGVAPCGRTEWMCQFKVGPSRVLQVVPAHILRDPGDNDPDFGLVYDPQPVVAL